MKRTIVSPEWLKKQKEKGNTGLSNLVSQLKVFYTTLCRIIKKLGLDPKDFSETRGRKKKILKTTEIEWLRKQLLEEGRTYEEIGSEKRCTRQRVKQIAKEYGIDLRNRKPEWYAKRLGLPQLKDAQWLLSQKKKGNLGLYKLAAQLGIDRLSLKAQIERLGLNPKDFRSIPKKAKLIEKPCGWCGKIVKRPAYKNYRKCKYFFCNKKHAGRWLGRQKKIKIQKVA